MRTPLRLFAALLMSTATLVACNSGSGGGTGIGPAGGTLTSANGVKLVIPAGALDAGVDITLADVTAAQVNPIISNPAFTGTLTKRFLGGFTAEPEGLTFNVPVEVTVPVSSLEPEETPVQLSVQLDQQTYSYTSSTLEYDGSGPTVTLELAHFSTEVVVGLNPPS